MKYCPHWMLMYFRTWTCVVSIMVLAFPSVARPDEFDNKFKDKTKLDINQKFNVGIVTGLPDGVYFRMGYDISRLVDERDIGLDLTNKDWVRVSVHVGPGSSGNLDDLAYLPAVSLAMVQSDVLEYYAENQNLYEELKERLRYVSRLHTEVLHIIARKDSLKDGHDVCALQGKIINDGGASGGTHITVNSLLNRILRLGVKFSPSQRDDAVEQLSNGKIDGFAYVVGRKADFFAKPEIKKLFDDGKITWVDFPVSLLHSGCNNNIQASPRDFTYEDAELTKSDYSTIQEYTIVHTVGVPAILIGYNFETYKGQLPPPDKAKYWATRQEAINRFIRALFSTSRNLELGLKTNKFNGNWCDVDLGASVRTWTPYREVETWMQAHAPAHIACDKSPKL